MDYNEWVKQMKKAENNDRETIKNPLEELNKKAKAIEIIKSYPHLVKIILETAVTYGKDNVKNYDLLKEVLSNGH